MCKYHADCIIHHDGQALQQPTKNVSHGLTADSSLNTQNATFCDDCPKADAYSAVSRHTLEKRFITQASNMGGSNPRMSSPTLARLIPQYMQCSSTDARLPPSVIRGKWRRNASRYRQTLCSAQLKTRPPSCDSPSCMWLCEASRILCRSEGITCVVHCRCAICICNKQTHICLEKMRVGQCRHIEAVHM